MTKFIYIADTHWGADPMEYQQQKGYPHKLPEILTALKTYLQADKDISFVLHGGDLVDSSSEESIGAVVDCFRLPVPLYLCLGNHDLTVPTALEQWMRLAPAFFLQERPEYSIRREDCIIHVVPSQWTDTPYYWEKKENCHFSQGQLEYLDDNLGSESHLPHIILTHTPVFGLPPEQTGCDSPLHAPDEAVSETITAMAAKHRNLVCVLGAHNHMNMCIRKDGVEYVTTSSLSESPFEFKLFTVTSESVRMETFSLRELLSFESEYNDSRSFVQGRTVDRTFSARTHRGPEALK